MSDFNVAACEREFDFECMRLTNCMRLDRSEYVDILMLSETKLDSNFPSIQFLINGFSVPHRLDRNSKGGGILLYVRDKIIVLPLNRYSLPSHIKILFFELNLRN